MAADPVDALDIALRVAAAVESLGGSYFVGGSLASSLHGEPRATNDIDIVLSLPAALSRRFCEALGPDFELDPDELRRALMRSETTNGFFLPSCAPRCASDSSGSAGPETCTTGGERPASRVARRPGHVRAGAPR